MIPLLLAALTQTGSTEVYSRPITDTFIDAQAPSTNYGREAFLKGGPDRAILIDFPGLVLHAGDKVNQASLILTAVEGMGAELTSVSIIRAPWRQGIGGRLVKSDLAANLEGATWTQRGGKPTWQTPGALGEADSTKLEGPIAAWSDDRLVVTGLGPALTEMLAHPAAHFGLRLEFGQPCTFYSADDEMNPPALRLDRSPAPAAPAPEVLELKPGSGGAWEAVITSPGEGEAIWRMDGQEFSRMPLRNGEQTLTAPLPVETANILGLISIEAVSGERSDSVAYALDSLAVHVTGASQADSQKAVDYLNQAAFPNSFSVFTPGGVRQRLRLTRGAEGAIPVTASGGPAEVSRAILKALVSPNREIPVTSNGWGLTQDARDDSLYVPNVPIPDQGWMPRVEGMPTTPDFGMLGRFEMGMLERLHNKNAADRARYKTPMPTGQLFLRMFDYSGKELTETEVKVWRTSDTKVASENPFLNEKSAGSNILVTSAGGDPQNLIIEATKGGLTERRLIPWTRLADEAMRVGEGGLASLELRWPLTNEPLDTTKNEASGALISDSAKNAPIRLLTVVDGKLETSLTIPADGSYWLELDLGRDMRIGEVQLLFAEAVPNLVDIQLYQTAEKPEWAVFWMRDRAAQQRSEPMNSGRMIRYRAASYPGRYVRIWMNPKTEVKLSEIRVYDINR